MGRRRQTFWPKTRASLSIRVMPSWARGQSAKCTCLMTRHRTASCIALSACSCLTSRIDYSFSNERASKSRSQRYSPPAAAQSTGNKAAAPSVRDTQAHTDAVPRVPCPAPLSVALPRCSGLRRASFVIMHRAGVCLCGQAWVQVWTNTCCSHQLHGQEPDEMDGSRRCATRQSARRNCSVHTQDGARAGHSTRAARRVTRSLLDQATILRCGQESADWPRDRLGRARARLHSICAAAGDACTES